MHLLVEPTVCAKSKICLLSARKFCTFKRPTHFNVIVGGDEN